MCHISHLTSMPPNQSSCEQCHQHCSHIQHSYAAQLLSPVTAGANRTLAAVDDYYLHHLSLTSVNQTLLVLSASYLKIMDVQRQCNNKQWYFHIQKLGR